MQIVSPGPTTSWKEGPVPSLGVPVTLYPVIGPLAGLHLTVNSLSRILLTSKSDGDAIPGDRKEDRPHKHMKFAKITCEHLDKGIYF